MDPPVDRLDPQLEWGPDNQTLLFGRLKMPEVLALAANTRLLHGGLCDTLTLDLSEIRTAFSAQALPLVVVTTGLRERNVDVQLTLPSDLGLRTLFLNTNWAHLIAPDQFPEESGFRGHHVPATTYGSSEDQQAVVNLVMDLLLEEAHVDREVMGGLEWSLNEITDNVLTHAGDVHGIVQVTRYESEVHIVVSDPGPGIGQTMLAAFPELADDVQAVRHAMLPGVTSGSGQGNGLAGIESIARLLGGEINVISGTCFGMLHYGEGGYSRWQSVARDVCFPGTAVTLQLPLDVELDLREALRFQHPEWEPFDYIDVRYEEVEGRFRIPVAEERRGVGTREAGHALRTKTENLLAAGTDTTVTVDFTGVRMIASSFADEFLGKLRADLGESAFDRRVRITGLTPELSTVLSGAVSQRMRTGA